MTPPRCPQFPRANFVFSLLSHTSSKAPTRTQGYIHGCTKTRGIQQAPKKERPFNKRLSTLNARMLFAGPPRKTCLFYKNMRTHQSKNLDKASYHSCHSTCDSHLSLNVSETPTVSSGCPHDFQALGSSPFRRRSRGSKCKALI